MKKVLIKKRVYALIDSVLAVYSSLQVGDLSSFLYFMYLYSCFGRLSMGECDIEHFAKFLTLCKRYVCVRPINYYLRDLDE